MDNSKEIKEKFDALYNEWLKVIQDPKIQLSSRPDDYTDNEPYRAIVKMGRPALPFVLEMIKEGVFLMNRAALEIAGQSIDRIIAREIEEPTARKVPFFAEQPPQFLSEQQKSELILKHLG